VTWSYYGFFSGAGTGTNVAVIFGVVSFDTGNGYGPTIKILNSKDGSSTLSSFTEKLFFSAIFWIHDAKPKNALINLLKNSCKESAAVFNNFAKMFLTAPIFPVNDLSSFFRVSWKFLTACLNFDAKLCALPACW